MGTTKIPVWSDPHPLLVGALCINVAQTPFLENDRNAVRVVASYGPADLVNGWKITITGSNGTRTISLDQNGNPLFRVFYPNQDDSSDGSTTGDVGSTAPGSGSGNPDDLVDFGEATILTPGSIITFEHDEFTPPMAMIQANQCRSNSASFLGYPAGHILSRPFEAESFYGGTRWHVKYVFEIEPTELGFNQVFTFRDSFTGRVPSDVSGTDGSNGILVKNPYEAIGQTADFTTLGLPTALLGVTGGTGDPAVTWGPPS